MNGERPLAIWILCIAIVGITVPKLINALTALVVNPSLYPFLWLLVSAVILFACYGIWNRRKWGVYLFIAAWLVRSASIYLFPLGAVRDEFRLWYALIVLVAFLAVVASQWKWFAGASDLKA